VGKVSLPLGMSARRKEPPVKAREKGTSGKDSASSRTGRRKAEPLSSTGRTGVGALELAALLENLPDAVVRLDRDFRHLYANPATTNVLGLSPEALTGKTLDELGLPTEVREHWKERVSLVFEQAEISTFDDQYESPGGLHYHQVRIVPEQSESGEVTTVLLLIQDVTERRRAEDSLRASEERFRVSFDEAPIPMALVGLDWHVQRANRATTELLGYSLRELAGLEASALVHPDDRQPERNDYQELLAGRAQTIQREIRLIAKSGDVVWARVTVASVRGDEGEIIHFLIQAENVTQLRLTEQALREREELQRAVIEGANDVIAVVDLDDRVLLASSSLRLALGYEPEELVGHRLIEITHADDKSGIDTAFAALLEGKPGPVRTARLRHKEGDWRLFEGSGSVARDEQGEPHAVVIVLRDITQRTLLERQLLVAQKMEAIGQLAGGIAHDFNNLLTAINGYSDLALRKLGTIDEATLRHHLGEIRKAGQRAAELTQHLLAFSGKQVLRPETVSVNAVVEEYADMLRRMIGEEIELVVRLEPGLGNVEVDPSQLGQVLTNLVINARDAMPLGGVLTVETSSVVLDDPLAVARGSLKPGSYVELSLADTGEGMEPEVREHIFEPFFTTKGPGQGTGLGLATVLGIVEQSGGGITVSSQRGEGTSFAVYLPLSDAAVPVARETGEKLETGSGTVLVVEDEEAVRRLVDKILTGTGYRVLVTPSPLEAISLANWEPSIDLLVTDVVMPEMNGYELAQRLLELRPELRVLYISGYSPEIVRARGVLGSRESFLQKPFTAASLTRAVSDSMREGGLALSSGDS
jgi:two-component system cell cycle sensor histidine kinase/response regulator CckA